MSTTSALSAWILFRVSWLMRKWGKVLHRPESSERILSYPYLLTAAASVLILLPVARLFQLLLAFVIKSQCASFHADSLHPLTVAQVATALSTGTVSLPVVCQ